VVPPAKQREAIPTQHRPLQREAEAPRFPHRIWQAQAMWQSHRNRLPAEEDHDPQQNSFAVLIVAKAHHAFQGQIASRESFAFQGSGAMRKIPPKVPPTF
jgi:hypothetical protein